MHPITIRDTRNASPEAPAVLAEVETPLGFIPNVFAIPLDDAFGRCAWAPSEGLEETRSRVA